MINVIQAKRLLNCISFFSICLLLSTSVVAQTASQTIPLLDLVKRSDYLDIKISPDGKHIAARVRENDAVYMITTRLSDGKLVGGVRPGSENEVASMDWVSNKRLIYTFAEKRSNYEVATPTGELFGTDIDNKSNKMLAGYRASDKKLGSKLVTKKDAYASHELLNVLPNDDKNVLIVEYPWSLSGNAWYDLRKTYPVVSKMNIVTGRKTRKETIPYRGARVFANDDGVVTFATWSDDYINRKAVYRASKEQPWEDISSSLNLDTGALKAYSINKQGTKIYLTGAVGDKKIRSLFQLELASKEVSRVFDNTSELDFWKNDLNGDPIVGTSYPTLHNYSYSLINTDSSLARQHKKLQKAFANQEVQIQTYSHDGKLLILNVSSDINPGEYYLYNTETNKADFLWANYSWIDPRTLASTKPISLNARDGQELHGYLTTPKDGHKNNNALVVLPHGGPHGVRDYPEYNPEIQLLVNRGYSVLQVNFRGSDGYGKTFEQAGYKNWGKVMVDDVIDATRWAIDERVSSKDRICIYGASYGGYSALMSAVKAPDLYKCAIGYVGVYDLEAMKVKGDIPMGFRGRKYLNRVLGSDSDDLKAQSPLTHAAEIQAKVMLIHGDEDLRVPSYHAKKMRAALKKANNPAEWLYLADAGHGAFSVKNRTKVYEGLLKFLDENIGE
ncbi:MAG: dipeptidyl aminopeptidase/acylaminoacyl peptidase [Arenicella sp.]|jgi:dipeptidyl aminopeptidase/acylaminoacyl peptidase